MPGKRVGVRQYSTPFQLVITERLLYWCARASLTKYHLYAHSSGHWTSRMHLLPLRSQSQPFSDTVSRSQPSVSMSPLWAGAWPLPVVPLATLSGPLRQSSGHLWLLRHRTLRSSSSLTPPTMLSLCSLQSTTDYWHFYRCWWSTYWSFLDCSFLGPQTLYCLAT